MGMGGTHEKQVGFSLRNICFEKLLLTQMRVLQEMEKEIYKGICFFDKGGWMDGEQHGKKVDFLYRILVF